MFEIENFKSINAVTRNADMTSDKYSFISTQRVLDELSKYGWNPFTANETKVRNESKDGFQKHLIRLQNQAFTEKFNCVPEILLIGAHDATSAFRLMLGIYRGACSNGLITGSTYAQARILHKGYTNRKVKEATYKIVDQAPKVFSQIEQFQDVKLNNDERNIFGAACLDLVVDEENRQKYDIFQSSQRLLSSYRYEDDNNNLWNAYNIAQEKIIKGSKYLVQKPDQNAKTWRQQHYTTLHKQRAVKSIDKNIKLNQALWTLTEKMAEIKQSV